MGGPPTPLVDENSSIIPQFDGNVSFLSESENNSPQLPRQNSKIIRVRKNCDQLRNNAKVAYHLPTVTVCNMRSFFQKANNWKIDFFEHQGDASLLCEVWHKTESKEHKKALESMLEMDGLQYFSTNRPRGRRGGGAAIIVNKERFHAEKLEVHIPNHIEVIWVLAKPKAASAKFKKIILCSFYSPPRSRVRNILKDHIIGTLQRLVVKYPDCGILIGGDRNKMDISALINNNLKLRQIVTKPTRKKEILDVLLTNLFPFYNSPVIIPPVQPDIPGQGVASDHSVPLCIPHTDPCNPPAREYRTIISRPLPESKIRSFGQWLVVEQWDEVRNASDPSQKVKVFEEKLTKSLDYHFPKKITKLGVGDKPYMTSELKNLKRKRMREYRLKGKSLKYLQLAQEFKEKLRKSSENFLRKNVDSLKETNPGMAYNILKKMGAQPGEFDQDSTFKLPNHENMSIAEAAEAIAEHFSEISREFPPLNQDYLPIRVTEKISNPESESRAPLIQEYEVYERISKANKPKSGVPGDLPKKLVSEFGPELAEPVCSIFNSIVETAKQGTAKWPSSWKLEYGTPLQKVTNPQSEDDLRVISLTTFFSKVLEKFVVEWLMKYIGDKFDPKQFGGLKGSSISHYMIEIINFILHNQDFDLPVAVLACAVDFSKAFNRQNHNILVTKLSDLGVPGWLLNLIMGFLSDRFMMVRYGGEKSGLKPLPGGGPQGTLLGLLLFLILINDCGFENDEKIGETITKKKGKFKKSTMHAKFVDDLTLVETINLREDLVPNPDRVLPDTFHERLGTKLDPDKSEVYKQIENIKAYAMDHEMKVNVEKCKFILFNPTHNFDFKPDLEINGQQLETMEEMKILGLTLRNDLSWKTNTNIMVNKAYKRLWIITRLKSRGANSEDLLDIYIKQIRCLLEYGVAVWNSNLTVSESNDIERVQKSFLHIVLGDTYKDYENALKICKLETLKERRQKLCLNFAKKAAKHPSHSKWFKPQENKQNTRSKKNAYCTPIARLERFRRSPIPYLTRLLNTQ